MLILFFYFKCASKILAREVRCCGF